ERLAQLGEAVAKINHDLRNSLATAQLVSDGLSRSEDPRVAKSLPRLERALERAIGLASDTLKYGRSSAPTAAISTVQPRDIVAEAASEALASYSGVSFKNVVVAEKKALADPDHLHRICANLIRNAAEAMAGAGEITVSCDGPSLTISDTGPGLPDKARDNLFKPFAGSTRRDGTGLGLALSRDLARAMGGDLVLDKTDAAGTRFRLTLPSPPA
ncbi:MAG: HAMP domain-containing sensor histidine kinase, partial [Myxococcota bacterium]